MTARSLRRRLVAVLAASGPALALAAPRAPAQVDAWSAASDRIAQCLGREDPRCLEAALPELAQVAPVGSQAVDFAQGVAQFLDGRFADAKATLGRVAARPDADRTLRERAEGWIELADGASAVLRGARAHRLAGGRVVVWLRPGPDDVLLGYLDTAVAKALPPLETAFGPAAAPIAIHVYPRADDLARVSGLTVANIRTSGTIALCKHNRVMLTSPQDLVFGYPWADTLAHELVHWFVTKRGGSNVPLWVHEGLARGLQGGWRGADPAQLDRDERQIAAWARRNKRFIPLERMQPSIALLPSQQDAQLAFAEVHHAVGWVIQRAAGASGKGGEWSTGGGAWIALFGQGQGEAAALARLTGLTPAAFALAWRRDWQRLDLRDVGEATARPLVVFRGGEAANDALRPRDAAARRFAEIGDRFAVLKRPLAAAIEYRKAIAAAPQEGPLLVARLVRVLLDLDRVGEAADYLLPALAAHPDHAPLHVLAGRLATARSQWRQALEAVEKAAWINPFDPQVHAIAAQAHAALGQDGEAAAARGRLALVDTP